jgi:PUA-domain protein
MKVRKRHFLKADAASDVIRALTTYEPEVLHEGSLELAEAKKFKVLLLNGTPFAMYIEGKPFFTVKGALELRPRRNLVTVDKGAIKYVINGADIMSPGIVNADSDITVGDLVVVIEEQHGKALAVGKALISGPEMVHNTAGKAVEVVHHIGDAIWNLRT